MVCTTFSWHSLKFYVTDHLAMIGSLSQGSLVVTTCLDFYRLISHVLFLRYKSLWTPFVWWMHDINCRELSISLLRSHDFRNSCSIYYNVGTIFRWCYFKNWSKYMQGTRSALYSNERESITVTVQEVTPRSAGALVALYERAVGIYASLVNINAYHQPGKLLSLPFFHRSHTELGI